MANAPGPGFYSGQTAGRRKQTKKNKKKKQKSNLASAFG